jgi:hypothetical protein
MLVYLILALLFFGLVFLCLAGAGVPPRPPSSRVHLGWFGLACWIGAEILRTLPK